MKLLVLAEDYPDNNGKVSLMYIHTRNLYYLKKGIEVTVLNFRAKSDYDFEGIKVLCPSSYEEKFRSYDLLVLHAANLKHHFLFLLRYHNRFKKLLFFYHGHEVLKINKVYPKAFPYVKKMIFKSFVQNVYDAFKLFVWRCYLPRIMHKSHLIFVSNWMLDEFLKWTHIPQSIIQDRFSIIYNCVGQMFKENAYDEGCRKEYDFVTIRANLDGSKYSVDVVNTLANNSPDMKFLVVGKGEYFSKNQKSSNITWIDDTLSHEKILTMLQSARFALMPTRTDSQGLMMCEMAAFGIPVVTSDIPVCHEVFDSFDNVYFIDNNDSNASLMHFSKIDSVCKKDDRFYDTNTIEREIEVIYRLVGDIALGEEK